MADTLIYFAEGSEQRGPFTIEQLESFNLTPDTLVWYAGLSDWMKASEAPLTANMFPAPPVIPPIPQQAESQEPQYQPQPQPYQPAVQEAFNQYPQANNNQYQQTPSYEYEYEEDCPKRYLALAILSLIFIFTIPLGIPALICSLRVRSLWNKGEYGAARGCSKAAKTCGLIGTILGGVIWIYIIICIIIAANTSYSYYDYYNDYYDYDFWDY